MHRANALLPEGTLLHPPCELFVWAFYVPDNSQSFGDQQNLTAWMSVPIQLCTGIIGCHGNTGIERRVSYV
jgi:hypothetical protein